MEEPDREDLDSDEKDSKKEQEPSTKQSGEKPTEEGGDGIKVSDVFLNMNLAGQKKKKKDDEDEEVDFERDED